MARVHQRGETAVAEFVEENWDLLFRSAYLICADRWIAEDIAQEAMLKAIAGLPKFDRSRPLEPWLSQIAANAARDWMRGRARRPESPLDDVPPQIEGNEDIAETLGRHALPDELAAAVLSLELPVRAAVVMRHLLDLSTAEIAALLGIEPATVRTRLHRGLRQMRQGLEQSEEPHA